MSDSQKVKFVGSGVNASSLLVRGVDSRGPYTPQGATWPFASLTFEDGSVHFRIRLLSIHKVARPANVTVAVSKLGYVYFKHPDKMDDFGFCTFKIDVLLSMLRKRGYKLDESCKGNLRTAKVFMYGWTALGGVIFALVTIMGILYPHGV